ncbi:BTB/POZ domain-containing protein At1g63850-like [Argentina anserina]|uniref:BTB/POZ domain-containing protein At1g63850-like n=1 Tax=Argentina anserina TaxID=57926 RepID=UPI00217692EA|nr:BTB/POZ domain-containing protein At1g63850-like [Potentilla anserina]
MKTPESPSQSSNRPNPNPLPSDKLVTGATSKKRLRAAALATSSCASIIIDSPNSHTDLIKPDPIPHDPSLPSFNHPASADVIIRLSLDPASDHSPDDVVLYLHAACLRRCKYFAALLSDRWQHHHENDAVSAAAAPYRINLEVPPAPGAMEARISVLRLLYSDDFASEINTASAAIEILPVALELLFEDCVRRCVRLLEAVPWTEEEESRVLALVPLLSEEESKDLIARVSGTNNSGEEMLYGLITSVIHNQNMAYVKAFVAKLLREFSSRSSAERVLERAFQGTFKVVKESMEDYTSPGVRGDHNETEAIQRLNLHTAMTNGRHLLWLVERMIELRVADAAVREWSEQPAFTADLQRAFRDDAWRNIVPGLPGVLLRCTAKLASAMASGTILVAAQVRKKLVNDWLPVLIVCKDNISPLTPNNRPLYLDLEETFLKIISTLPMLDAQELLQQCLGFSTRNYDDCPHLVMAFNTWFRRAARPSQGI